MIENDGLNMALLKLRVYSLAASLVHCGKNTFVQKPTQMRTILSMVTDASEILSILLEGKFVASAGRLADSFLSKNKLRRRSASRTYPAFAS